MHFAKDFKCQMAINHIKHTRNQGCNDINEEIITKRWKWLGHCLRMDNTRHKDNSTMDTSRVKRVAERALVENTRTGNGTHKPGMA